MSVFVGLDCGGSSSRVLAVDELGNTLFQGHSGAANLVSTPEPRLRRNLATAVDGCPVPAYVCGCFAGLISDEVRRRGEDHLRYLFPQATVRAEPDYTAAFYASPPSTDICIIAGTGSLVCSRNESGVVKSGGRGYLLGDFGSSFQYGRDALTYFLDQKGEVTESLETAIFDTFGTFEEGVIVAAVYRSGTPAAMLAKLAKTLGQDAKAGAPYALESIRRNGGHLAEIVQDHVERHFFKSESLGICLAGGLWKSGSMFQEMFVESLENRLPDRKLNVNRINRPPLLGAVELAKEMSVGN